MYNQSTRVQGGSSFADAMFRFSAGPEHYAQTMFDRVVAREWGEYCPYTFHSSPGYFIIAHKGSPVMIKDYSFVEEKRSEAVRAFENWVLDIIGRKAVEEDEG